MKWSRAVACKAGRACCVGVPSRMQYVKLSAGIQSVMGLLLMDLQQVLGPDFSSREASGR